MIGLCHSCLTSNVELTRKNNKLLCADCHHNSFSYKQSKQSPENRQIRDPATLKELKKKLERK